MGSRSWILSSLDRFRMATGFSRLGAGCHLAWEGRGTLSRIAFPIVIRSSTLGPKTRSPGLRLAASFCLLRPVAISTLVFIWAAVSLRQLFAGRRDVLQSVTGVFPV